MTQQTQWNGEPCTAMRVTVTVADSDAFLGYWARDLVGTRRNAVLVDYAGSSFYLDDHDGSGWNKVTHGGSPRLGHRNLIVEPGSVQSRNGPPADDTSTLGAIEVQKTTRVFAALHQSAEQDVSRVIALYEQWVKSGAPPLGVPMSRWWDARLIELHNAISPPDPGQRS